MNDKTKSLIFAAAIAMTSGYMSAIPDRTEPKETAEHKAYRQTRAERRNAERSARKKNRKK